MDSWMAMLSCKVNIGKGSRVMLLNMDKKREINQYEWQKGGNKSWGIWWGWNDLSGEGNVGIDMYILEF